MLFSANVPSSNVLPTLVGKGRPSKLFGSLGEWKHGGIQGAEYSIRQRLPWKIACFLAAIRWQYLWEATRRLPSLPDLVGWVDVFRERQPCRYPGHVPYRTLKMMNSTLNCTWEKLSATIAPIIEVLREQIRAPITVCTTIFWTKWFSRAAPYRVLCSNLIFSQHNLLLRLNYLYWRDSH